MADDRGNTKWVASGAWPSLERIGHQANHQREELRCGAQTWRLGGEKRVMALRTTWMGDGHPSEPRGQDRARPIGGNNTRTVDETGRARHDTHGTKGQNRAGHRCQPVAEQGRVVPHRHYDRVNNPSMAAEAHVRELDV
jgi:hypothetical protein